MSGEKVVPYWKEEFVGVKSSTDLTAIYNPKTKKWDVKNKASQSRTRDGKEWEERHLETHVVKESLDVALSEIILTVDLYLQSVNGDMFSETEKPKEIEQ